MTSPIIRCLSVLPTPVLVLGSAHELYLRNQQELDGAVSVLAPFWLAAIAAAGLGCALTALADWRGARLALWAYHLAGGWFLAYSVLRGTSWRGGLAAWALDQTASVPICLAGYFVCLWLLSRRDPAKIASPLALLAAVLMTQQALSLGSRLAPPKSMEAPSVAPPVGGYGDPSLPNVYHLVLDSFDPGVFDRAWPPESPLDGFVYFRGTRAPFQSTRLSMSTVFTSRPPTGHHDPLQAALSASDSLPRRLRDAGYRSVAYLPPNLYPPGSNAFDYVHWHTATLPRAEAAASHRWLFLRFWFATVVPAGLLDSLAGRSSLGFAVAEMRSLKSQRVSVLTQAVTSFLSFERYLESESRLPAGGRYTFIHLLVPHNPFVLASDCSHSVLLRATSELDQSRCAARLMRRFLDRLDELGRLRGSLVLIHSDHGSFRPEEPGRVQDHPALLLLKAPLASGPLRRMDDAASLLDVSPTLLDRLGIKPSPEYQGRTLGDP